MKRLMVLLISLIMLSGCVTTGKMVRNVCPPEDVMYGTIDRGTGETGDNFMEKGFFEEEKRGTHWLPVEDYQMWMRRMDGY